MIASPILTSFSPDTDPVAGDVTDADILTLNGTALADSTVTIYDGTTALGTVAANSIGVWTYITPTLADGTHSISATATDALGASAPSSTSLITVIPSIANFQALTDQWSSPITVDGQQFYVENSNVNGNAPWNIVELDDHTLQFQERPGDLWPDDGTQRTEVASNLIISQHAVFNISYSFMIDPSTLPNTASWLTMGQIHGDDSLTVGSINPFGIMMNNNSASDGQHLQVWISYLDTSGSEVDVMLYQDPNAVQGGHWYNVQLTGKPGVDGTGFLDVWIDGVEAAAYNGKFGSAADENYYWKYGIYEGGATNTLIVTYKNMTFDSSTISLDTPNILAFSPDSGVAGDGITNANKLTLTGTSAASSTVTVYDGSTKIGTAVANTSGDWSLATPTLADGSHSFTATETQGSNTSPLSPTLDVTVDTAVPNVPVISSDVVSAVGSVTLSGTAAAGGSVTVYNGATSLGTAAVDASGDWSFADSLANGTYQLTATVTNAAGTASPLSAPSTAVVNSAPNVVVNGGFETQDFTGWTLSGNTTFASPWGPPQAGSNAAELGPAGSDGILSQTLATVAGQQYVLDFWLQNTATSANDFTVKWNGVPVLALLNTSQQGYTEYTYYVVATGNATPLEFDYMNDGGFWDLDSIYVGKAGVAITSPGQVTSQPIQMITGTVGAADVGSTVTVFDGTNAIGTARVQSDGGWSVAVTLSGVGVHTITATDTGQGWSTAFSNTVTTTLSSSAPAAGILQSLTPAQEIAAIYVGYFNRAPDAGGFAFWEGQYTTALGQGQGTDTALTNIANSFAPQAETLALYPFLATEPLNPSLPADVTGVDNLIVNVYANLFDRAPPVSDSGVQYWAGQILSGAVPLGEAILFIANGATGSDADVILNKIVVDDYFVTQTAAANISFSATWLTDAHAVLMGVTSNPLSVTTAENTIDALIAGSASVEIGTLGETLTAGTTGGDILFPVGGADSITLGGPGHTTQTIYWGATYNASSQEVIEPVTNAAGVTQQGFWGNAASSSGNTTSTSADMSVVHNFTPGASGDSVAFVTAAWGSGGAHGNGVELGLVEGDATTPAQTGTVLGAVQTAGAGVSATANVIVDGIATYANAAALAAALASSSGHFMFAGTGLAAKDDAHMLVAYSTGSNVNIADVEFNNVASASQTDTAHLIVAASDMVQLTGVSLASLSAHNIGLIA